MKEKEQSLQEQEKHYLTLTNMELQPPKPQKAVTITENQLRELIALKQAQLDRMKESSVMPAIRRAREEKELQELREMLIQPNK